MGWFSRQTEYLRLYTLMNFDMKYHKGSGVVRWESLEQHPNYSPVELRLILAALQYARTLVNHAETRSELFVRVGQGAGAIASGALQLAITPWELEVGGMYFQIWPWIIHVPGRTDEAENLRWHFAGRWRGRIQHPSQDGIWTGARIGTIGRSPSPVHSFKRTHPCRSGPVWQASTRGKQLLWEPRRGGPAVF